MNASFFCRTGKLCDFLISVFEELLVSMGSCDNLSLISSTALYIFSAAYPCTTSATHMIT